ncbi:MAG: ABC transporter permease [Acidobacteriia bacterium]|nr:ABC transporter permease [Terriglobia bacterium]
MERLREFLRRMSVLLHLERFDRELEEEMRFHVELQAAENREDGMDAEDARQAAVRRFGNAALLKETSRQVWRWSWIEALGRDVSFALRLMHRGPLFAVVTVLTLALGLGANMAIFTMVYHVVLRPVRYRDPDRLMDIHLIMTEQRRGTIPMSWSYPKLEELRQWTQSFESVAAWQSRDMTLGGIERPERLTGAIVSARYFRIIGADAARGRLFSDDEDTLKWQRPVMLISDGLWHRDFGGDPGAVGRTVRLDETPFTIVGVLPAGFLGESGVTDVWVPMAAYLMRYPQAPTARNAHNLNAIGRLKAGVSPQQANEEVRRLVARMEREHPSVMDDTTWSGGARTMTDALVDPLVRNALWILQAATAALLLIACLNLAGLLLGRSVARRREIAIRLALGVSRRALMRQLLVEPVMLAVLGGAAGLLFARWGASWLGRTLPATESSVWFTTMRAIRPETLGFELPLIVLFTLVSLITGLLFGFLPAWRAVHWDVNDVLKSGGATTGNPPHLRMRNVLVIAQTVITLVMLTGAGLMTRNLAARLATDVGAETRGIVTIRVATPRRYRQAESLAFYEELRRRAAALPRAEAAAISNSIPLNDSGFSVTGIRIPGVRGDFEAGIHSVSPEFFTLFRIPLLKGRSFTDQDRAGSPLVVLLNETAARQFFPIDNPIGRHIAYPQMILHQAEIIGVVGDVKYDVPEKPVMADVYLSMMQSAEGGMLAVRTTGDPLALVPALRAHVRALDPELPIYDAMTMGERLASATWRARLGTVLLSAMSALALLLAAIGIYGVFTYRVAARTRDIGLRLALGAGRRDILRMILREGVFLCAISLALGLPAALALSRLLTRQLYGVTPYDPLTFLFVAVLLAVLALTATYLPARRATRIDPMEILRHE